MTNEKIISIGLLTASDLKKLGSEFARAFPVDDENCFEDLIAAIDQSESESGRVPEPMDA